MKNKLFLLNIISLIILYHLVYHFVFYFLLDKEDMEVTPIGFLISNYDLVNPNFSSFLLLMIVFVINVSICGILLYFISKWYDKKPFLILFCTNILVFIVVSLLLFLILLIIVFTPAGMLIGIVVLLYAPMPIMAVLMIPLFVLNKKILESYNK